jgi:hypothetical protein
MVMVVMMVVVMMVRPAMMVMMTHLDRHLRHLERRRLGKPSIIRL